MKFKSCKICVLLFSLALSANTDSMISHTTKEAELLNQVPRQGLNLTTNSSAEYHTTEYTQLNNSSDSSEMNDSHWKISQEVYPEHYNLDSNDSSTHEKHARADIFEYDSHDLHWQTTGAHSLSSDSLDSSTSRTSQVYESFLPESTEDASGEDESMDSEMKTTSFYELVEQFLEHTSGENWSKSNTMVDKSSGEVRRNESSYSMRNNTSSEVNSNTSLSLEEEVKQSKSEDDSMIEMSTSRYEEIGASQTHLNVKEEEKKFESLDYGSRITSGDDEYVSKDSLDVTTTVDWYAISGNESASYSSISGASNSSSSSFSSIEEESNASESLEMSTTENLVQKKSLSLEEIILTQRVSSVERLVQEEQFASGEVLSENSTSTSTHGVSASGRNDYVESVDEKVQVVIKEEYDESGRHSSNESESASGVELQEEEMIILHGKDERVYESDGQSKSKSISEDDSQLVDFNSSSSLNYTRYEEKDYDSWQKKREKAIENLKEKEESSDEAFNLLHTLSLYLNDDSDQVYLLNRLAKFIKKRNEEESSDGSSSSQKKQLSSPRTKPVKIYSQSDKSESQQYTQEWQKFIDRMNGGV